MIQSAPIYDRFNRVDPKPQPKQAKAAPVISKSEDDWLLPHKVSGASLLISLVDGEQIKGTVGKLRKFSFVVKTETGEVLVLRHAIKTIRKSQ